MPVITREIREKVYYFHCSRCGYRTNDFTSPSIPGHMGELHKPLCKRAAAVGLRPIFESSPSGKGKEVKGWNREIDFAELVVCHGLRDRDPSHPTGTEVRFYSPNDKRHHEPLETYPVHGGWDWLTDDVPWRVWRREERPRVIPAGSRILTERDIFQAIREADEASQALQPKIPQKGDWVELGTPNLMHPHGLLVTVSDTGFRVAYGSRESIQHIRPGEFDGWHRPDEIAELWRRVPMVEDDGFAAPDGTKIWSVGIASGWQRII